MNLYLKVTGLLLIAFVQCFSLIFQKQIWSRARLESTSFEPTSKNPNLPVCTTYTSVAVKGSQLIKTCIFLTAMELFSEKSIFRKFQKLGVSVVPVGQKVGYPLRYPFGHFLALYI